MVKAAARAGAGAGPLGPRTMRAVGGEYGRLFFRMEAPSFPWLSFMNSIFFIFTNFYFIFFRLIIKINTNRMFAIDQATGNNQVNILY